MQKLKSLLARSRRAFRRRPTAERRPRAPEARRAAAAARVDRGVAERGGALLHFDCEGTGAPVILIPGLAMTAEGWWRTVPVLARDLRVITYDPRGVGRSAGSPAPASVAEMADDAAAVIAAAGEERVHVYGISLGGMIAQELALRHPDRVDALVLGATTPGGFLAAPPDTAAVAYFMRHNSLSPDEAAWASVPHLYARETQLRYPERIAEDVARRLEHGVDGRTYTAQVTAGMSHDALSRLRAITAPTLVVHGEEDRIVPPANARSLALGIPDAELHLWPEAGHMYMTDRPEADEDVRQYLLRRPRAFADAPALAAAAGA